LSEASATSGMGQSRHFDRAPSTSGLARLADILRVIRHVSNVLTGDMSHFTTRTGTLLELYNSMDPRVIRLFV
jgi:hypothetical protein